MMRQPIHTLYGGAHLYRFDATLKLGGIALRAFDEAASSSEALRMLAPWLENVPAATLEKAYARTRTKLTEEPIEDQRIDFEDGFGPRSDAEEDAEAVRTAKELARAAAEGFLPPFVGIRVRNFGAASVARAKRTLDLFCGALASTADTPLLPSLLVTLPKVSNVSEVHAFVESIRHANSLFPSGPPAFRLELMVETPSALLDETGCCPLPSFIDALGEQGFALHLGAYDLTSELGVPAPAQALDHPYCAQARFAMQCAAAGRIHVVDGATTLLPLRQPGGGDSDGMEGVRRGWALHGVNIRGALENGIYQGWDLHPAQLGIRYVAVYTYFLEAREAMAARLRRFIDNAAKASRVGAAFDDAATGLALLGFFRRGFLCRAFDAEDLAVAGLTPESVVRSLSELCASAAAVGRDAEGAQQ